MKLNDHVIRRQGSGLRAGALFALGGRGKQSAAGSWVRGQVLCIFHLNLPAILYIIDRRKQSARQAHNRRKNFAIG